MFSDITDELPLEEFERIKAFVLSKGDRQTYRNFDNNSPHLAIEPVDVYLSPATGQRNINCDLLLSDFNEIVIRDRTNDIQYFILKIVREGDLTNSDIRHTEGLREGKVYLLNPYEKNMVQMKEQLIQNYLPLLRRALDEKK